jgi:L-fuconolactonase
MTIDAHVHIWDLERAQYPWLGEGMGELHRSVEFSELLPTLRRRGVDGAILVQASDEAADTEVMLRATARHPEIVGVVGYSPIDQPQQLQADLDRFATMPVIVGIRNLVHEHPREWMRRPAFNDGLALLAHSGLSLDFPTATHQAIPDATWVADTHRNLRVVLDHLGKPPIGGTVAQRREWRSLIAECASNPRTVAKLSGLYAMVGPMDSWTTEMVRPFVDDALELFGPERLMYGGDWPISVLAGGYERTWLSTVDLLAGLDEAGRSQVLEGTARRVYLRAD